MSERPLRAFCARHAERIVAVVAAGYVLAQTVRAVRHAGKHPAGALEALDVPLRVSDFESFYRCALRMQRGLDMYHVDSLDRTQVLEQPSKQAPFFELLLQPFVGHGIAPTLIAFGVLTAIALVHSLALAKQLLARADGLASAPRWLPAAALGLLAPALHLNLLYFQTGVVLVWLFLLGARWLGTRPLRAGLLWSLGISIKVVPIVFLAFLVWRRRGLAVLGCLLGLALGNGAVLAYTGVDRGFEQYRGYVAMLRADPAFGEYHERYQGLPSLVRATVADPYRSDLESSAQKRDWNGTRNLLPGLAPYADALTMGAISLVLLVCAAACGCWRPVSTWRLFQEASLVAIAMLLVSPHTWRHYYWWLFPAALVALRSATSRRRLGLAAVAALAIGELLPHRGLLGAAATWFQVFHGHAIAATVVFVLLAAELLRRPTTPNATTPSA